MKMIIIKWIFLHILSTFLATCQNDLKAQNSSGNSHKSYEKNSKQQIFDSSLGMGVSLYTGFSYWRIGYKTIGHPFFKTDSFQTANLTYKKIQYKSIPILYDIHQGAVVINSFGGQMQVCLIREQIDSLEVAGSRFHQITALINDSPVEDLMELVVSGNYSLYVRHRKILQAPAGDRSLPEFKQRLEWYVNNGTGWKLIDNEQKMLNISSDKKDIIRAIIRKNKWSFKKSPGSTLNHVIQYLNSIN